MAHSNASNVTLSKLIGSSLFILDSVKFPKNMASNTLLATDSSNLWHLNSCFCKKKSKSTLVSMLGIYRKPKSSDLSSACNSESAVVKFSGLEEVQLVDQVDARPLPLHGRGHRSSHHLLTGLINFKIIKNVSRISQHKIVNI
jgi:hypothetical protein